MSTSTDPAAGHRLICVVTPCYNEEDCFRAVRAIFEARRPDCDPEHLFADNASTDATVAILHRLAAEDRYVPAIHSRVRKRPMVIERERINFTDDDPPAATPRAPAPYLRPEEQRP